MKKKKRKKRAPSEKCPSYKEHKLSPKMLGAAFYDIILAAHQRGKEWISAEQILVDYRRLPDYPKIVVGHVEYLLPLFETIETRIEGNYYFFRIKDQQKRKTKATTPKNKGRRKTTPKQQIPEETIRITEKKNLATDLAPDKADGIRTSPQKQSNKGHGKITDEAKDETAFLFNEYEKLLNEHNEWNSDETVMLGLDFGTSFTKAAFYLDANNHGVIPFGDEQMKASVIYTDTGTKQLSMFKTETCCQQIRFFKATMSNDCNYNRLQSRKISSSFSFMATIFFLANILRYIELKLSDYLRANITLQVNMGAPTLFDDDKAELYRKALHTALYLHNSTKGKDIRKMDTRLVMDTMNKALGVYDREFYLAGKGNFNTVFPELFAEALFFIDHNNVPTGFYGIVDIGGGTADLLILEKNILRNTYQGDVKTYTCYGAAVEPLGNEIRLISNPIKYKSDLQSIYGRIIMSSKNKATAFNLKFSIIKTFIFGGGKLAENSYYDNLILNAIPNQIAMNIFISIADVNFDDIRFIQYENIAENNRKVSSGRFLIASQLALTAGSSEHQMRLLKMLPTPKTKNSTMQNMLYTNKERAGYEDFN